MMSPGVALCPLTSTSIRGTWGDCVARRRLLAAVGKWFRPGPRRRARRRRERTAAEKGARP